MRLRPPAVRFPQIKNYHAGGRDAPMPLGGIRAARSLSFSTKVSCRALQKRVWYVGRNGDQRGFLESVSPARKSKGKAAYATFPFPALIKPWALPIPDFSLTIALPFRILLRPWGWRISHFSLCARFLPSS